MRNFNDGLCHERFFVKQDMTVFERCESTGSVDKKRHDESHDENHDNGVGAVANIDSRICH